MSFYFNLFYNQINIVIIIFNHIGYIYIICYHYYYYLQNLFVIRYNYITYHVFFSRLLKTCNITPINKKIM
jgi:hypothetical protein